jgi:hypothetical protein
MLLFAFGGFIYGLFAIERTLFTIWTLNTSIIHLLLAGIITLTVLYRRRRVSISQPKSIGLFSAWISAKKQRICPLIEIVDDANTTDIV